MFEENVTRKKKIIFEKTELSELKKKKKEKKKNLFLYLRKLNFTTPSLKN